LVGGWFSLRSKQNEYANTYYKLILERRLAAYEEVEQLIAALKIAVVDLDRRPYHQLFSKDHDHAGVYMALGSMSNSLWLSDDLFQGIRQLNLLVYRDATKELGLVEFGKRNYAAIAGLRTQLEKMHIRDMLNLHDAPAFLKAKRPADSYSELPSRN
jgi:hypothetical protein